MINPFEIYLTAPIIALSLAGYKVWFMIKVVRVSEMDVRTGIRDEREDLQALEDMDRAEEEGKGWWKSLYVFLC